MSIFISILLVVAGIIGLLLIIALFTNKAYNIQREIIIDAPQPKVFNYLKHIKNQDNFNKWVMVDPNMKRAFKGTDGTVGFIYGWNGNKQAGEGEQEIMAISDEKVIEIEIRFVRPLAGIAFTNTVTESLTENQTKVSWTIASRMKYPFNIMLLLVGKMLAKDMDASLSNLKGILEK